MLPRTLLCASAALQAWYLHAASLAPRWNGPREAVAAARWVGLLAFALAVAGGVLSVPELRRGDKARVVARFLVWITVAALALLVLSARTSGWQPSTLQKTAVFEVVLAILALLA